MSIIDDREKTHGPFSVTADVYANLRLHTKSDDMSYEQITALDMILMKIARIIAGNPDEIDHWRDIAGYAELVVRSLEPAGPTEALREAHSKYMATRATDHAPDCEWHVDQYASECGCGAVK